MDIGPAPHIETAYLTDGVAGNPAGALLFLIAARDPSIVYPPIGLGDALVRAEQRAEGDTIYKALRAQRGCLELLDTGYLAIGYNPNLSFAGFRGDVPVRASPHLLPYKLMIATAWLDAELSLPNKDIPERRITDIVGQNRFVRGRPGAPSLSMALYEAILASEDGTVSLSQLRKNSESILQDDRMANRIQQLRNSGALQETKRGYTRIRPNLAPFVGSLLRRMRLLAEHATDPDYHRMAKKRAEAILTNPADIHRLLAKTQRTPENKRPNPPRPPKPPAPKPLAPKPPTRLVEPPATPAGHLPMRIRPGVYPPDWPLLGLCTTRDVDLRTLTINPGDSEETVARRIKEARRLCPKCPVSSPCARAAIAAGDKTSIAGHTPAQRAALTPAERQAYLDTVKISPHAQHPKTS
jgi:hypothetical protein